MTVVRRQSAVVSPQSSGGSGESTVFSQLVVPIAGAAVEREVGGKACNLGRLSRLGIAVPDGFVATDAAFRMFLDAADLRPPIASLCERIETKSPLGVRCAAETIAALVREERLPQPLLDRLTPAYEQLPGPLVIVRSSAVGEDSAGASFAGQLDSIAGVRNPIELGRAVINVWASRWSERVLAYQVARGVGLEGMGVIVQHQIDAQISGVLFTRAPGDDNQMLVEYCFGLGDALVGGRENPGRIMIARPDSRGSRLGGESWELGVDPFTFQYTTLAEPETSSEGRSTALDDRAISVLARTALAIEREFGAPQDIEWTIDGTGAVWIVQARPITVTSPAVRGRRPAASGQRSAVSGQQPAIHSQQFVLWSNANVNENFPQPISPLLYSVASAGYYHYFRNLGRAFGISRRRLAAMEQPLRHIIGVHGARMYYNLTSIHTVLRSAPFGDLLAGAFNQFVGADELGPTAAPESFAGRARNRVAQAAELATIAAKTTWQYAFLTRRVERFERTVDAFAGRTHPDQLAHRPIHALLENLRAFLDIRCHRWNDAALADAGSMVCYGALQALLARAFPAADQQALHNTLLKALPGLVSSLPAVELWKLSRAIREIENLAQLFATAPTGAVASALREDPRFQRFRGNFESFLENWGFRCSGELMLTVPSFQEDPAPLVDLLKAYAAMDGESPVDLLDRQQRDRQCETDRVLASLRGRPLFRFVPFLRESVVVSIVLRWTQKSIQLRERARLKQALLYSRLRRIVLAIGDRLAAQGRIDLPEDGFYLTTTEIDTLATGSEMFPDHVRDLIALRRRAHTELSAMTPPDSMTLAAGEYLPASSHAGQGAPMAPAHTATSMQGTSACGGATTGRATILTDVSQSHLLAPGDVLVTRQTDPGWATVFPLIAGLVMERGGMLSHGAIIAREFGIPSVVGVRDATRLIPQGGTVRIDGDRGLVHLVEEVA